MTNQNLSDLIDRANGQAGEQVLFVRPLTDSVYWAKAWEQAPVLYKHTAPDTGYSLYLIRSRERQYVGIVLDMGPENLHWLVQPAFRKQGYLSTALRDVILPHLLQDRATQRITLSRNYGEEEFEASNHVARAVGFVPEPPGEHDEESQVAMRYTPADWNALPVFEGRNQPLSDTRLSELKQHFAYHANCLRVLRGEVLTQLGESDFTEHMHDLARQVHSLGIETEDTNWDAKRDQSES